MKPRLLCLKRSVYVVAFIPRRWFYGMHFVVCIKQVPDTSDITIDPETNTLIREGVTSIINPYDTYAIEEAVRLCEKMGGKVTALTMGPPQAEDALREAISMGVNDAILISDPIFAGSDTWATSYTLSMALRKIADYRLILCGKQAIDGDTAQVGPGIAAHLNLPQITFVRRIKKITPELIIAERLLDEGVEVLVKSFQYHTVVFLVEFLERGAVSAYSYSFVYSPGLFNHPVDSFLRVPEKEVTVAVVCGKHPDHHVHAGYPLYFPASDKSCIPSQRSPVSYV